MTQVAYCDTNVFDHIHKRIGVTETDMLALRSAIQDGRLSILLSLANLEETLGALESFPDTALAELQLILELTDWNKLVKPAHLLLTEDIGSYARGEPSQEPFVPLDPEVQSYLEMLSGPTGQDLEELRGIIEEVRHQKEHFRAKMKQADEKLSPLTRELRGAYPTFNEYCEMLAEKYAEGFAEHEHVLDACHARGIAGLLQLRTVRMAVGASLSLAYGYEFEGRAPAAGDSRDLLHAVMASVTDIFVTQDGSFRSWLTRVPIDNFQVLDIAALLNSIDDRN